MMMNFINDVWLVVLVAWIVERLMGAVYFAPKIFGREWILAYRGSVPDNAMQILFPLLYDMVAALILQLFLVFLVVQTGNLWVVLFAYIFHAAQFKAVALMANKSYRIIAIDMGYLFLAYGCSALIYYILLF